MISASGPDLQTVVVQGCTGVRDIDGALIYANHAYASAVEAKDAADAMARGIELLDRAGREQARSARAASKIYAGRIPAIVAGNRRIFDVLDVPTRNGSAGIGIDVTEIERLREIGRAHV